MHLRDWEETELEPFSRLIADEKVMRYFPKTLSTEESNVFYKLILSEFKECGFGLYAVEVRKIKSSCSNLGKQ